MITLPLYDCVGYYGYFFENENEYFEYKKQHTTGDEYIKHIILVDDESNPLELKNDILFMTREYAKRYFTPMLPFWIKNNENFNKIIKHDFNEITPQTAEIITTLNCCFRCEQCSYKQPKERLGIWNSNDNILSTNHHMTLDTVLCIIDRLKESGTKNIVFTGGGEPLFNPEVTLAGMSLAKKNNMNVGLYTNGVCLTDNVLSKINEIDPLFIRVSIYGADPSSFKNYTNSNEATFFSVIKNIKKLIEMKVKYNRNYNVSLSFLMHPILFQNIELISTFFEKYFNIQELSNIYSIRFTPAVDYYDNNQHDKYFFDNIYKVIKNLSKKYNNITNIVFYQHRYNDLYNCTKPYSVCRAAPFYIEIAPNADIYLCCEKLMDKNYLVGNIIENTVKEVFSSEKYHNTIKNVNSKLCADCPPLCKPHEINKQLNNIDLICEDQLFKWRTDLIKIALNKSFYSGSFNDFES